MEFFIFFQIYFYLCFSRLFFLQNESDADRRKMWNTPRQMARKTLAMWTRSFLVVAQRKEAVEDRLRALSAQWAHLLGTVPANSHSRRLIRGVGATCPKSPSGYLKNGFLITGTTPIRATAKRPSLQRKLD